METEKQLPGVQWTGERIVWRDPAEHMQEFGVVVNWYMEAMKYAKSKRVIDAACGTGFGSFMLSLVAEEVIGLDIQDMEDEWDPLMAATVAANPFKPAKLKFIGGFDFEKEAVDITADLCVSIETIEHLINPDFFLENLKAKAIYFTVPCYGNKNPFHKIEYTEQSCKELIERHFPNLTYRMEGRRMFGYAERPTILP